MKPGMIKTRIIGVVVFLVVIFIIAFFYRTHINNADKIMPKLGPAIVPFATAKQEIWQKQVQAIGTIYAKRGVTLRAEVAGRITHIYFQSGQFVKKGQPLFQIYPDTLKAQAAEQRAQLNLADYELAQQTRLYKQGAVSELDYKRAISTRNLDAAKLAETESQLRLTTVRAPFNGLVGVRQVEVGDSVQIGDELTTFQSKQDLRVDFWIPGTYASQVHAGQKATFTLNGNSKKVYHAVVYGVNPLVNPDSRMMEVRASIESNDIMPGSYAEVTLYLGQPYKIVVIPQTAVMRATYGEFTYVVKHGKAHEVVIHTSMRKGADIGVTQGLTAGDVVVSGNQLKVHNKAAVTDVGATPLLKDK